MIFKRALLREFSSLAIAVFLTLLAVTLTTQLIRLLGQAAGGSVLSEGVLLLLGFSALNYLPVLLSLTVFISVLMALSRSYRDSEMVIWFSCGLPLTAWIRPVLSFAGPMVVLIAGLSLFLSPWAMEKSNEYRRQMEKRDDLSRVSPGVFREAADADRVFFVESVPEQEGSVQNVFISTQREDGVGIMVSRRGLRETGPDGSRYIVLLDGRQYQGRPGSPDFEIMNFQKYALRVQSPQIRPDQVSSKAMSSLLLWRDPTNPNMGELLWRVGLPLSALVLAMLAIPLSFVNPRASRSVNLAFALLMYMVYSNLISIAQAWVSQGRLSFEIGWWIVHMAMAFILASLFWYRARVGRMWRR